MRDRVAKLASWLAVARSRVTCDGELSQRDVRVRPAPSRVNVRRWGRRTAGDRPEESSFSTGRQLASAVKHSAIFHTHISSPRARALLNSSEVSDAPAATVANSSEANGPEECLCKHGGGTHWQMKHRQI